MRKKISNKIIVSITILTFLLFIPFDTIINADDLSPGEWTEISDMNYKRGWGPGAVLLDDGRILVAGGKVNNTIHASAEIYNPQTNKWTKVSDMNYKRRNFLLVKLNDGRVMAIGGKGRKADNSTETSPLKTVEIYDPETNKWTLATSMNEKRVSFSGVTLEDSKVLVIGGGSDSKVDTAKNTAEIYDPKTDEWTKVAPMLEPRFGHDSVLMKNGKVLVTGGSNPDSSYLRSSEVYDLKTNEWSRVARMSEPKRNHKMVRLADERILLIGGKNDKGYLKTTEFYHPNADRWSSGEETNFKRRNSGVTLMADGRVLVAGGRSGDEMYLKSAEIGFFNRAPIVNLLSPVDGKMLNRDELSNINLRWIAEDPDGDDIKKYRLRVGTSKGKSDILDVTKSWSNKNTKIEHYSIDLSDIDKEKTIYWTVMAQDEHGEWSDWADTRAFQVPERLETSIEHVDKWQDKRESLGLDDKVFLAGEPFLLTAKSSSDVEKVEVTDPLLSETIELDRTKENNWSKVFYDEQYSNIKPGEYTFKFRFYFENGKTEETTVKINILGEASLGIHQTF